MTVRAALAAVLMLLCCTGVASAQADRERPPKRPNIVDRDDRRPDARVDAGDVGRAPDAGRAGHDLRARLRVQPALLPVALHSVHRPVLPQPRRARQPASGRRLRAPQQDRVAADLAAAGGLPHRAHRQVPQPLRGGLAPHRGATGLERVVRLGGPLDLPVLRLHAERERPAQHLRPGPQPALLLQRLLRPASDLRDPAHGRDAHALLPLGGLPRAAQRRSEGRRRSRRPAHAVAGAAAHQPLRRRAGAAGSLVQRVRRLGQADLHPGAAADQPAACAGHRGELPPAARVAAVHRRGRGPHGGNAASRGRARQHADRVHQRQRLLPRRAPPAQRQGARLRAVDPGAAPDARPWRAGGRAPTPAGHQRRPGAHHPRRRRAPTRPCPRTAARCSG